MIDKIYSKDRRMVNNAYKGNMLSTAVLTDMHRYHNLKSSTGVEVHQHDQLWLQGRIEEEKADAGLSLDCAPERLQKGQLPQPQQPITSAPRSNLLGRSGDSTTGLKKGESEISNPLRQSLVGTLGEALKAGSLRDS